MTNKTALLPEVAILRPFTILLLVMMHSFTVFAGNWEPFEGFVPVDAYKWLSLTTFSFLMELFVFISGYVLAYQILTLKRDCKWSSFAFKKFKRLIIPSIIFSLIYIAIFAPDELKFDTAGAGIFLTILGGYAHLWFLPMLFWCCIIGLPLMKMKVNDTLILIALFAYSAVSWVLPLPLRMDSASYYIPFFYLGYWMYKRKEVLTAKIKPAHIIIFIIIFVVSFLGTQIYINEITATDDTPLLMKAVIYTLQRCGKLLYATTGLLAAFTISIKLLNRKQDYTLPEWVIYANSICFGVYIIHQFLLQGLYYYTSFPTMAGPYVLPWVGFVGATIASAGLAAILIKTKAGRFLIG